MERILFQRYFNIAFLNIKKIRNKHEDANEDFTEEWHLSWVLTERFIGKEMERPRVLHLFS